MNYRTILVATNGGTATSGAVELTARLAKRFTKTVALAESNGALTLQI